MNRIILSISCLLLPLFLSAADPYQGAPYGGKIEILFEEGAEELRVVIETDRLVLESVCEKEIPEYIDLFSNPEEIAHFATGEPIPADRMEKRLRLSWIKRWQDKDPFSAFAVRLIEPGKQFHECPFVGHIVSGYGDEPGVSEMAFLLKKQYRHQGYGKEAVAALVGYAKSLADKNTLLEGKLLAKIEATTRIDNLPSNKVLEYGGFHRSQSLEKWDGLRYLYTLNLETED